MAYKRKYLQGKPFKSYEQLFGWLAGGNWVYLCGRPKHPLWILHMRGTTILMFYQRKMLSPAIKSL